MAKAAEVTNATVEVALLAAQAEGLRFGTSPKVHRSHGALGSTSTPVLGRHSVLMVDG